MIKHDTMNFPHTTFKYFSYSMPHLLHVKPRLKVLGHLACDSLLSCVVPNNSTNEADFIPLSSIFTIRFVSSDFHSFRRIT